MKKYFSRKRDNEMFNILMRFGNSKSFKKLAYDIRLKPMVDFITNNIIKKETKMSKMINIKGKDISEDTIVEALKKHINFMDVPILGINEKAEKGKLNFCLRPAGNGNIGLCAIEECGAIWDIVKINKGGTFKRYSNVSRGTGLEVTSDGKIIEQIR